MAKHAHASAANWRFPFPEHTRVFASVRVLKRGRPVLVVIRRPDGDWVFSCGTTEEAEHEMHACLGCMVDADPTLAKVAELTPGTVAFRNTTADAWRFVPLDEEDDE